MKKILLFAAAVSLLGAGCLLAATGTPKPAPAPAAQDGGASADVQLGESFTLKTGETRVVQGGLRVTLESIGDSRCKKGVQCIWAGELSPKLLLALMDAPAQELTLGTLTKPKAEAFKYAFELTAATESQATLVVTQ